MYDIRNNQRQPHKKNNFMRKTLILTVKKKKPWGLGPIIKSPLYKIKIHEFTWLLILRLTLQDLYRDPCLHHNTSNALVDSSQPLRECKSLQ